MKDEHNQKEEYMTFAEIILSTIFMICLIGTCWIFLLITYNL